MCRLETSWDAETAFPEFENAMDKLQEMQKDGLVELSENGIKITEEEEPLPEMLP
jgi:oxygen-independent coproporphyrinogen-3 oxidase